jgi:hypothetical protein
LLLVLGGCDPFSVEAYIAFTAQNNKTGSCQNLDVSDIFLDKFVAELNNFVVVALAV